MIDLFNVSKPVIGMVHLPATPGTPRFDAGRTIHDVVSAVQADIDHLVAGGVDGLMFCNEDDRPYSFALGRETVAFMTRVITECRPENTVFGVDVLWDAKAALAIAAATEASFIREVVSGTYESDMGLWSLDPADIWNYRNHIGAQDVRIFANIQPEFASPIGDRDIAARARSVLASCIPDALLVSGPMAGVAPDRAWLEQVRSVIPDDVALVTNTGAKPETVGDYLSVADGVIVGSSLKIDGGTWNPVDPARVAAFMEKVAEAR